ncbi:hypothetical protein ACFX15_021860 [Malus domestica]
MAGVQGLMKDLATKLQKQKVEGSRETARLTAELLQTVFVYSRNSTTIHALPFSPLDIFSCPITAGQNEVSGYDEWRAKKILISMNHLTCAYPMENIGYEILSLGILQVRSMSANSTFSHDEPLMFLKLTLLILTFEGMFCLYWFHGQYCWSMRTGLLTLTMIISSKCISDAIPSEGEAGHVLILTPLDVLVKVQFLTLIPTTGSSFGYLPRLPMLMPWPGPQVILVTVISLFQSPMETQSSPVLLCASVMLIPVERPIWIPSVFMLSPGAMTLTRWNVTLLHPKMLRENSCYRGKLCLELWNW